MKAIVLLFAILTKARVTGTAGRIPPLATCMQFVKCGKYSETLATRSDNQGEYPSSPECSDY